jgi:hypothetical protein
MKLEQQLSALRELGIALEPDVSIDDLLYSFDREAYEAKPFDALLFILGATVEREPWERPFCRRVWGFDTECIEQTGDYVAIAERLSELAGHPGALIDLRDHVDLDDGEAWIEYTIEGRRQRWDIEVDDDWADLMVVSYLMADLERDGWKFRKRDNGQAMVLYYLDEARFARLNQLAAEPLSTMLVE